MLAVFAYNVRKNFAAHGTRLDFLPLESFTDTFARTIPCIVARGEFLAANFAHSDFDGAGTFGNFFAFGRAVGVVTAIGGFIFATADRAGEFRFFIGLTCRFNCRVNFLMRVLRDEFKICNVVIVVIEVAVVNIVTVRNFAVEIRPHKTVYADCATEIFARVPVEFQADEFFLRVADGLNRRHNAFDFTNHFFDGKRFLRCLDAFTQELKNFFTVFHCNASILTNSRRNVTMNTKTPRQACD